MERRRAGGAGVRAWRQRPPSPSPSPPAPPDDSWESGRETPAAGDEDFNSQMDENGIIGLAEATEEEEEKEGEGDLAWDPPESPSLGGDPPRDALRDLELEDTDPPEELSYGLSELQDSEPLSPSPVPSLYEGEGHGEVEDWGVEGDEEEEEEVGNDDDDDDGEGAGDEGAESWVIHTQEPVSLPERDRQLDMTDEEEQERDSEIGVATRGRSSSTSPGPVTMAADDEHQGRCSISVGGCPGDDSSMGEFLGGWGFGASTPCERGPHRLPHLLHLSREEEVEDPVGIEEETLPECGFIESLPESRASHLSQAPTTVMAPPITPPTVTPTALTPPPPSVPATATPNVYLSNEEEEEEEDEEQLFFPLALTPEQMLREEERGGRERRTEQEKKSARSSQTVSSPGLPPTPSPRKSKTQSPSMHHSKKAWTPQPEPSPSPCMSPESGVHRGSKDPRTSGGAQKSSLGSPDSDSDRRGPLSFPVPDFSKVEPRVRFPKGGVYRPPKSRAPAQSGKAAARTAQPLVVFKSPADIVREVLMGSGEGPPPSLSPPAVSPLASSLPAGAGARRHLDITVPQEFRSPQQASALVHQLQEDYNRLLTKYAEAENTIDRLRLEAKVGLYSDPPKPSHSVQSGTVHRRAEFSPDIFPVFPVRTDQPAQPGASCAVPSPGASTSSPSLGPQFGEQLSKDLSSQAEKFQAQLDSFEDLLRSGKLKPFEQMKGVASLVQGQDWLERGYLGARDKHRLLQLQGKEPGPFDPDREVEGWIFRLGMRLEELREEVEPSVQEPPSFEAPPSPPLSPDARSSPLGAGPTPHPESPVSPVRGGFGEMVGAEVSSVSGESEGEEGDSRQGEELPHGLPPALRHKHRRAEQDFSILLGRYQSVKELPGLLDLRFSQETTEVDTATLGHDGTASECGRTESRENGRSLYPMGPNGDEEAVMSPPFGSSMDQSHHIPAAKPLPQPLPFAGQQGGDERRGRGRKSHSSSLASLGGSTNASERRVSKLRTAAPSQDGLASPETDSGFMGSETSRLTPAATGLPQQGAKARPPPGRDHVGDRPRSGRGSGGGHSLSASSSPRCWDSSMTSQGEPESEQELESRPSPCVLPSPLPAFPEGEKRQGVRHTQQANQQPRRLRCPSPAIPSHHGDSLRAPSSGQLTDRHEAIQSLQDEVTRLKEVLEGSLRCQNPSGFIRTPPSALEDSTHPHNARAGSRSAQCWQEGWRKEAEGRNKREREVQKERGQPPRPTPRKRSASVPHRRLELDITTDSEHDQYIPKERSSRRIPESSAQMGDWEQAQSETVTHRGPYTRQVYRLTSTGRGEEAQEREQHRGSCPNCSPIHAGKRPVGGTVASHRACPPAQPCPLCHRPDQGTARETVSGFSKKREVPGSTPQVNQPRASAAQTIGGVFLAAGPPPMVQGSVPLVPCVPVCPSVLYFSSPVLKASPSYLQHLYLSLDGGVGTMTVKNHGDDRRHARSFSATERRSMSRSLSRAIEAAHGIRATSRSISRSLTAGLHQQGVLTQSYLR
ncbi:hypothetical protein AGOR_G00251360 [Albula goreensis]|uniref:AKNA domain-containing protein n=1 Tax=Albula goreensis TaxID=1534307 RepID=A0A8T3CCH3_9TELE|nr:hypothetical protein AGOR_G00251360 [Albula goreensis]